MLRVCTRCQLVSRDLMQSPAVAANRANAHFHPDLTRPGLRRVHFLLSQRRLVHTLLLCQDHRAHSWLNSHKGSKTLTGFFTTFYARRAFCNSAVHENWRMFTRPMLGLNTAQEVGSPRLENRDSC